MSPSRTRLLQTTENGESPAGCSLLRTQLLEPSWPAVLRLWPPNHGACVHPAELNSETAQHNLTIQTSYKEQISVLKDTFLLNYNIYTNRKRMTNKLSENK